jgi:enolase
LTTVPRPAGVPSGASTGAFEAVELPDGGSEYGSKGVARAVDGLSEEIQDELLGHEADDQRLVDQADRSDRAPASRGLVPTLSSAFPWR